MPITNPYSVTGALLQNLYSNPAFNEDVRDITNPSLSTGKNIAKRLGIKYDLSEIQKIFEDAVAKGGEVNKEVYDQATKKFYENIASQSANFLDTLRKNNAGALNTGASRGVAAANELSALLGMSQQSSDGALDLALQGMNLGDKLGADTAQAAQDALLNYNQLGMQMGGLDNESLAAWVQQYVAELQYLAEQNALVNAANNPNLTGGYGGSYKGSYAPKFNMGATGAPASPADGGIGRFTEGFLAATTNPDNVPIAQALGSMFDEWDKTGKVNPITMNAIKASGDPQLVQAMYKAYMPLAQNILNGTSVVNPATGEYRNLAEPIQPEDTVPVVNPYYGKPNLVAPSAVPMNRTPIYQAPAYQKLPTDLVPTDVRTGMPEFDAQVDKEVLAKAYQYAVTKGTKGLFDNSYQHGDFLVGNKEKQFIAPSWDEATQNRVREALTKGGVIGDNSKNTGFSLFGNAQEDDVALSADGTLRPVEKEWTPSFKNAIRQRENSSAPNAQAVNMVAPAPINPMGPQRFNPQVPLPVLDLSAEAAGIFEDAEDKKKRFKTNQILRDAVNRANLTKNNAAHLSAAQALAATAPSKAAAPVQNNIRHSRNSLSSFGYTQPPTLASLGTGNTRSTGGSRSSRSSGGYSLGYTSNKPVTMYGGVTPSYDHSYTGAGPKPYNPSTAYKPGDKFDFGSLFNKKKPSTSTKPIAGPKPYNPFTAYKPGTKFDFGSAFKKKSNTSSSRKSSGGVR